MYLWCAFQVKQTTFFFQPPIKVKQTLLHNIQGLIYYIRNPSPSTICPVLDDIDIHHHTSWYTVVPRVFLNCITCLTDIEPSSTLINIEMYWVFNLLTCMNPCIPSNGESNVSSGDMVKAFWNEFLHSWECSNSWKPKSNNLNDKSNHESGEAYGT